MSSILLEFSATFMTAIENSMDILTIKCINSGKNMLPATKAKVSVFFVFGE